MKIKTLLLSALTLSQFSNISAQSFKDVSTSFTPSIWTKENKSLLGVINTINYENREYVNNLNASIYNDSFESVGNGTLKCDTYETYVVKEREMVPTMIKEDIGDVWQIGYTAYERFEEEYDTIWTVGKTRYGGINWYEEWKYGKKYPTLFAICRYEDWYDSHVVRLASREYVEAFTGNWVTEENDWNRSYIMPTSIRFLDLDEVGFVPDAEEFIISQTLFDNDEEFEYLFPEYVMTEEIEEEDRDNYNYTDSVVTAVTPGVGEIDRITTEFYPKLTGYNIVSIDGNVKGRLEINAPSFENKELANFLKLIRWGGKLYFNLEYASYDDDKDCMEQGEVFFLFNRETSEIKKVDAPAMFRMIPQVAKRHETVEIEIADEASKNGGEIIVTDMGGRKIYTRSIRTGEKIMQMPVNRLSAGIYGVSFVTKGKRIESSKLIVR